MIVPQILRASLVWGKARASGTAWKRESRGGLDHPFIRSRDSEWTLDGRGPEAKVCWRGEKPPQPGRVIHIGAFKAVR
jgi:hypothetical protein